MMFFSDIAKICYEVNKAYCEAIGETILPFEDVEGSTIEGVINHMKNPSMTPKESHEKWMEFKRKDGWKYGPVKNVELKEHPRFIEYDELPTEQKAKDYIFKALAKQLLNVKNI